MAMDNVNLTQPVRTNLLALQNTTKMMSTVQERLATGLKVNSAIDNPASFFTAKSLNDRAFDLSGRLDGIGQGIQTLKTADKALSALNDLVTNAKSLANRALDEVATTISEPKTTFETAKATLSGGTKFSALGGATATVNLRLLDASGSVQQSVAFTFTTGTTVDSALAQINNVLGLKASLEDFEGVSGTAMTRVTLEATDDSTREIEWSGADASIQEVFGFAGATGSALANTTTNQDALDTRKNLAAEFDDLRQQMKALVEDAGYKGVNLLNNGDLTVKFNEKGDNNLKINGVNFDVTAADSDMAIGASLNNWASDNDVAQALNDVENAVKKIRSQASTFGSNLSVLQIREEFTTEMINGLEEGAGKLVQADMNRESANMLALQTRQQLSTTSLSMASQAEQNVLRLF